MGCKFRKYFYIILIQLLGLSFCFSQAETIRQTLVWDSVEYVSKYEIAIEKKATSGEWQSYTTIETKENTLDLQVPVGEYRYHITVFNILNRAEPASDWYTFNVYKAVQPKVRYILPDKLVLNKDSDGRIEVVADNTVYNSIFTLTKEDGTQLYGAVLKSDGVSTILDFDEHRLTKGLYTLTITNPGGLFDNSTTLDVDFQKESNVYFAAGYKPSFFLSGGSIVPQLGESFVPFGASASVSMFGAEKSSGFFGVSLSLNMISINTKKDDFEMSAHLFPLIIQGVYKYPIVNSKLYCNVSLGAGLTFLYNLHIDKIGAAQGDSLNAFGLTATAALSLQVFATENIYFDVGSEYVLPVFIGDSLMHLLNPFASIGWKF